MEEHLTSRDYHAPCACTRSDRLGIGNTDIGVYDLLLVAVGEWRMPQQSYPAGAALDMINTVGQGARVGRRTEDRRGQACDLRVNGGYGGSGSVGGLFALLGLGLALVSGIGSGAGRRVKVDGMVRGSPQVNSICRFLLRRRCQYGIADLESVGEGV